jgi:hypothetical protein
MSGKAPVNGPSGCVILLGLIAFLVLVGLAARASHEADPDRCTVGMVGSGCTWVISS